MDNILILYYKNEEWSRTDYTNVLAQIDEIMVALKKLGYNAITGEIGNSLLDVENLLKKHKPALVFNMVESFCGSDQNIHLVAAYLEAQGIRYTGCPSASLFLTGNKVIAKKIMHGAGIATPYYFDNTSDCDQTLLSEKFIVKSITEDASVGIDSNSVVQGEQVARSLILKKAKEFGGEWMAEQYIDGREINVSVTGSRTNPKILPIAEIIFKDFAEDIPKIVDYSAKWDTESHSYNNTLRNFIDEKAERLLVKKIKDIVLQCWYIFEIHGYARVDLRVDNQENPWVLEVNANPCLSSDAGFAAASEKSGMTYVETINNIMDITNHDLVTKPSKTSAIG